MLNIGQTLRRVRKSNDGRNEHQLLHLILYKFDFRDDFLNDIIIKYNDVGRFHLTFKARSENLISSLTQVKLWGEDEED